MTFIVEIQPGCWLADLEGDPGRTLVKENAKHYRTEPAAKAALTRARKFRPLKKAKIVRTI